MCDTFKPNGLRVLGKGGKNKGSKTINVEKTKTTQEKKYVGEKDTIVFPKLCAPVL